jgi:type II secretory pathway pseudopilin PulG
MSFSIRKASRRRGLFTMDILIGLTLMAIAGTILTVLTARHMSASAQLSETREAVAVAENVLLSLQAGHEAPVSNAHERIEVTPLPDGAIVEGLQWVRVVATVGGQSRSLTGLVPAKSLIHDRSVWDESGRADPAQKTHETASTRPGTFPAGAQP